jgi:hypothetical protein
VNNSVNVNGEQLKMTHKIHVNFRVRKSCR